MLLTLLASQDIIKDPSLRRLRERCKKLAPFKRKQERWVLDKGDIDESNIANLKRFCLAESLIALRKGSKLEGELVKGGRSASPRDVRRVILRCYENSWKVWEDLVNDDVIAETDGESLIIALYFASRYLLKLRAGDLARLYIQSMTALLRSVKPQRISEKIIETLLHISTREVPHDNRTLEDDRSASCATDSERADLRFNGLNILQKKALAHSRTLPADLVIDLRPKEVKKNHQTTAQCWLLDEVARILNMNSLDQWRMRLTGDRDSLVLSDAIWKKLKFVHTTQVPALPVKDLLTRPGPEGNARVRELLACLVVTKFLGRASVAQPLEKVLTAVQPLIKSGLDKSNPAALERLIIDKFDLELRCRALKESSALFRGRSESPFINSVKAIVANAEAATIAIILLAEGQCARAYATAKLACDRCVSDILPTDWQREFGELFDSSAQRILSAALTALTAQVNQLNEAVHFEKLRALALLASVLKNRRCGDSRGLAVPTVTAQSHSVANLKTAPSSYHTLVKVVSEEGEQNASGCAAAEVSSRGLHRTIRETLKQMLYKRIRCAVPPITLDLMPLRKDIDRIYWCHQPSCEGKVPTRKALGTGTGVSPKHDLVHESDRDAHYWWRPS